MMRVVEHHVVHTVVVTGVFTPYLRFGEEVNIPIFFFDLKNSDFLP